MYDFYLGSKEEINKNKEKYLLSIKRMMPKWMNSIPDSEFIALSRTADNINKKGAIFVETGAGASTIALLFHAMKNNGKLYSWDTNGEKTSQLRSICNETISKYYDRDINKHWKSINYISTSEEAGLKMLNEMGQKIDLFFHDSDHVLDIITGELKAVMQILNKPAYICMDDANYNFKHTNIAYANIVRKKVGLQPISNIKNNSCDYFYLEVEKLLKTKFDKVVKIKDTFKKEYKNDIYFDYFDTEFKVKAELKMENEELLAHRFDCWKIG
jgi:predicted O-methyltransferase YrrM